jgi:hypothetical protein
MILSAAFTASAFFLIHCGGDSDDDSAATTSDDTADDTDSEGGFDFQDPEHAKASCIKYYMVCGMNQENAEMECAYIDGMADIWSQCIATAMDRQFACFEDAGCDNGTGIFDCISAFTAEAETC